MSITAAQLVAEVTVKGDEEAKSKLKSVGETAGKVGEGFKGMLGGALSFAGGLGIYNLAGTALGFLKDQLSGVFAESMDAQAGMALTTAVLKSTHDASGETAQGIADLAGNLSHLTKFSDDTTQAAENMLLTFTNIGKDVFPQATKTVLDMSQALGQDTKSSAIQLGKALNDPITGVTALQRVGVTFNQTQKDLIKGYVDHGQVAKAQGVILQELQKEFGGAAEAAGKTFGGQLTIANQYVSDIKQNIGDDLMPIVSNFLGIVEKDGMPILQRFSDWFTKDATPALQDLSGEIGPLVSDVENFAGSLLDTVNNSGALQSVLGTIHDILPGIRDFLENTATTIEDDLLPPVLNLVKNFSDWLDKSGFLQDALSFLDGTVSTVASDVGIFVGWLSDLFGWLDQNKPAAYALKDAIFAIGGVLAGIKVVQFGKDFYGMLKDTTGHVKDFIGELGKIKDKLGEVKDFFTGKFKNDSEGALQDVGKEAENTGKSVETIGTDADLTKTKVVTDSEEMGNALGTDVEAGALKADTAIEGIATTGATVEGEVGAEAAGMEGELAGVLAELGSIGAGAGLMGMGGASVHAQGGTDPNLQGDLQKEWGKLFGGQMPPQSQWSSGQFMAMINAYAKDYPQYQYPFGISGHASGIMNNPVGHWSMVGEQGPEPMYVPQGASIFPNSAIPSLTGGGNGYQGPRELVLEVSGYQLGRVIMPLIVEQKRMALGVRM